MLDAFGLASRIALAFIQLIMLGAAILLPFSEELVEKLTGTVTVQPLRVLVRKIGETPVLQI